MNAFQGLINQTTSLEVPLANEVLALLLIGSLLDSWETLVVTLSNAGAEGKHLSLVRVKSSLLNEEAQQKYWEPGTESKALVIESDTNRGRGQNRSPQKSGEVGDEFGVKGEASLFLLRETGALPKELSTLPKR